MKRKIATLTMVILMVVMVVTTTNAKQNYTVYVNGKNVGSAIKQQSIFFVSEDVLKQMGEKYSRKGKTITINKGKKTIVFNVGSSYYVLNGKKTPILTKKIKNTNVPVYVNTQIVNSKMMIPLNILQSQLGYPVKVDGTNIYIGKMPTKPTNNTTTNNTNNSTNTNNTNNKVSASENPIYDYWMRKPFKGMYIPKLGTPQEGNDELVLAENAAQLKAGWVMPVLPANLKATDDWTKDSKILLDYLEMKWFNPNVTIAYSPSEKEGGFESCYFGKGLADEGIDYLMTFREPVDLTRDTSSFQLQKINWIHPQILRYYFPTKWEEIWDNMIGRSGTLYQGKIYVLDGREFIATFQGDLLFSKVGGKLNRNQRDVKNSMEGYERNSKKK